MPGQLELLPSPEQTALTGWPWSQQTDPHIYKHRSQWPKISIVTPSFNQGIFLEATIRSVLLQNYPNLEYLVIDGGSTDETLTILHKYGAHLTYWISEADEGQSAAINKGLSRCNGDYFNWINSDDYLEKDALFNIASQIHPSTSIIAGYCTVFDDASGIVEMNYRLGVGPNVETTIINHTMCQPSMFYKTEVLKASSGLDESLHYTMDLALFISHLSEHGINGIQLIAENISFFRKHNLSKTVSIQEKFEEEERKLYAYLLSCCNTGQKSLQLISAQPYQPAKPWTVHLNQKRVENLIYKKFILRNARHAYARADYRQMKIYLKQYLSSPALDITSGLLKLIACSYLIPKVLLSKLRVFYKSKL